MPPPNSRSDSELLRHYVEEGSQGAFTTLVERHIQIVYRAALRGVGGNTHTAEDVSQKAFTDLARKAHSLTQHASLVGWLYTSARYAATDAVRAEQRRRIRETEAHVMNELHASPTASWDRVEPLLFQVMDKLPALDREAVLLHFLEGKSFPEIGELLEMSPDATRMKVKRALERLRAGLEKHGITSTTAALVEAMLTQSATAAPAHLAATVASRALSQCASLGATAPVSEGWLQLLQSLPRAIWIPGAAVFSGIVGFSSYILLSSSPTEAIALVSDVTQVSVQVAPVGIAETEASIDQQVKPRAETRTPDLASGLHSGKAQATVKEAEPALNFRELTFPEKRILKLLWGKEQAMAPLPGRRWGISVASEAPNHATFVAARKKLRMAGLVAVSTQGHMTFLSKEGLAFCAEHSDEINAFTLPRQRSGGK